MRKAAIVFLTALLIAGSVCGQSALSSEALKMLQDPMGWQFASVEEERESRRIFHGCFDNQGQPHPSICRGNLTLRADGRFVQVLHVGNAVSSRRGTYRLAGRELTLVEESGKTEGPYAVDIRPSQKSLALSRVQNGVRLGFEFELDRAFQARMRSRKADPRKDDVAAVTAEMFVPSVEETVRWYEKELRFWKVRHEEGVFAAMQFEDAQLLFAAASLCRGQPGTYDSSKVGHGIEIRIMVKDVDAFYARVKRLGLPIILDIKTRYYGLRDFIFQDLNGFHLRIASFGEEQPR